MSPIERAGFLAHAKTPHFQRRIEQTRALIQSHKEFAIAVSWGKDSSVLLHLAAACGPVFAINARYGNDERLPDCDTVRDGILAKVSHVTYYEVRLAGEREMYRRHGGFFMDATTPEQKEAVRWWKRQFTEGMLTVQQQAGMKGVMLGLRADESHARAMNFYTHGESYTKRNGEQVVTPLAKWSGKDIWAYLCLHELPWMHIYDCGGNRTRERSDFVFATGGAGAIWRHGAWETWKKAYPELFASWVAEFPEMSNYL